MSGLTEREQRNPQFDFLKPTHGLFGYFTQLVESYSKVLIPRQEQLVKMQRYSADPTEILRATGDRYLWDKYQEEKRQEEAANPQLQQQQAQLQQQEDAQMMDIDWGDFVVVGKIDLYDDEEMKMIEDNNESEAAAAEEALRRQSKNLIA